VLSPPLPPLKPLRTAVDCRATVAQRRPVVEPQQISVTALLASEVFPARSTAFTVNVFAPLAVA
jgi:hypothetical protein